MQGGVTGDVCGVGVTGDVCGVGVTGDEYKLAN